MEFLNYLHKTNPEANFGQLNLSNALKSSDFNFHLHVVKFYLTAARQRHHYKSDEVYMSTCKARYT